MQTVSQTSINPGPENQPRPISAQTSDASPLQQLTDNTLPDGQREALVDLMLDRFGDKKNKPYYILVAKKIDQRFIWQCMAEIKQDPNVDYPERVFATRMRKRAIERLQQADSQRKQAAYGQQRQKFELMKRVRS